MAILDKRVWSLVVVLVLSFFGLSFAATSQHTVGDSSGWSLGVDYSTWASSNTFNIGDTLNFPYAPGAHSVVQVNQQDYDSCSTSSALSSDNGSGNTVFTIKEAGTYYFVCGVFGHCQQGMKLTISTVAQTPSTSPATPISPTLPPTISPPSSITPPSLSNPPPSTPSTSNPSPNTTPPSTPYATYGNSRAPTLTTSKLPYYCFLLLPIIGTFLSR